MKNSGVEYIYKLISSPHLSISESQAGGELPPVRLGDVLLYLEPGPGLHLLHGHHPPLLQPLPLQVAEHGASPRLLPLAAAEGEGEVGQQGQPGIPSDCRICSLCFTGWG